MEFACTTLAKTGAWFDEAAVEAKFGVRPTHVVDVLALVGDTSDNVSGVPGIGKKGAIDLVTTYGGLDALLEQGRRHHPEEVPRGPDLTHRAEALRSRRSRHDPARRAA